MTAPQPVPGPYALAAPVYQRAGWRGIIPVAGKWPPPTGWTGAAGQWPSGADLQAWMDGREGRQNIALRLPEHVIGIDVDAYGGKPGAATLASCEAAWGPLPPTWRSTSRDDGVSGIRLLRVPAGLGWPGELPGGGVEVIQVSHRYAVCWPSRHPEGRTYRWIDPDGAIMASAVPRPEDLPELPARWVDGLSRGPAVAIVKAHLPEGQAAWLLGLSGAEEPMCPRMATLTRTVCAEIPGAGSRHETARPAVVAMVRRAEQGHPGGLASLKAIGETFVLAVEADRRGGREEAWKEWVRLVEGAVKIVAAGPRTPSLGDPCMVPSDPPWHPGDPLPAGPDQSRPLSPALPSGPGAAHEQAEPAAPRPAPPDQDDVIVVDSAAEDHARAVADRLGFHRADREARRRLDAEDEAPPVRPPRVALDAFLAEPDLPVPSRISSLMPIGARVLLTAQMKTGKTTLVGNLLRALCDGTPFLGFPVVAPEGSIVLIDLEMDARTLRRWLRDMRVERPERARIVSLLGNVRAFDILDRETFTYWVGVLREAGCAVLIIDCLKPILDHTGLDERSETGRFTTTLTRLMKEAGISELILVHHMGHFGERARGDSALRGWPEVEWQLVRLADNADEEAPMDAPRFFKAYGRDVNVKESAVHYDPTTRTVTLNGAGNRKEALAERKNRGASEAIIEIVRADPGIPISMLRTALSDLGHGVRNTKVAQLVEELVAAGRLRKQLGGATNRAHKLYLNDGSGPREPMGTGNYTLDGE